MLQQVDEITYERNKMHANKVDIFIKRISE